MSLSVVVQERRVSRSACLKVRASSELKLSKGLPSPSRSHSDWLAPSSRSFLENQEALY